MFHVCLPHQHKVYTLCIFSQIGSHHESMLHLCCGRSIGVKCLSQRHNDILSILEMEARVNNFAKITNLRFYPPSSTATSWDDTFEVSFPKTKQQYAQYIAVVSLGKGKISNL